MTRSPFTPYLQQAASGTPLSVAMMEDAMTLLLQGHVSDIEMAGFLMALRARGETIEEITAAAQAMRQLAVPVSAPDDVIDTAGTGGDGAGTYNISTAAALVAAGAGAIVAKHGNRAATSKSGSSEVLEALGVNLKASPEVISECIDKAGVGFMFAAFHHQAVANVAPVRKALGIRTIFNMLGPLTNPAGAKRQLIGVFDKNLTRPLAAALGKLGARKAWIVHGSDGLDELTLTGPSHVCALNKDTITEFMITPEDAGLSRARASDLEGGTPQENANALQRLLEGETGAYRDITLLNAAAALIVTDKTDNLHDGVQIAAKAIDTGHARKALKLLVEVSNQ